MYCQLCGDMLGSFDPVGALPLLSMRDGTVDTESPRLVVCLDCGQLMKERRSQRVITA